MILVDTNVIIDFWKNPSDAYRNTFMQNKCVICGMIKAELMHGALSDKDMHRIEKALNAFDSIPFSEQDWNELGLMLYTLRSNGVSIPYQDATIALIALKNDLSIWSNDKHFKLVQDVYPNLKLFSV